MLCKGMANMARHYNKNIAKQARMASHGKATRYFTTRKHRASYGRAKIAFHRKLWQAMAGQVIAR